MKFCRRFSRHFGLVIGIALALATFLNIFELIIHLSNSNICFRILEFIFDNYNAFTIITIVLYFYEFKYYLVALQCVLLFILSYVIWIYRKQSNSENITNKFIVIAVINVPISIFILYVVIVVAKTSNIPSNKIFNYYEETILQVQTNQSKTTDLVILDFAQTNECDLNIDIQNSTQQSCLVTLEDNVMEVVRYVTHVTITVSVTFVILVCGIVTILKMRQVLMEKQRKLNEQQQEQDQEQELPQLENESEGTDMCHFSSLKSKIRKQSSSQYDSTETTQWTDSDDYYHTNYFRT